MIPPTRSSSDCFQFAGDPLGVIRLDWRRAVKHQLDDCAHGQEHIKPVRW
jgi:hypothetical protein